MLQLFLFDSFYFVQLKTGWNRNLKISNLLSLFEAVDDFDRPSYFHKNVARVESVEFGEFFLRNNFVIKSHFLSVLYFKSSSFARNRVIC